MDIQHTDFRMEALELLKGIASVASIAEILLKVMDCEELNPNEHCELEQWSIQSHFFRALPAEIAKKLLSSFTVEIIHCDRPDSRKIIYRQGSRTNVRLLLLLKGDVELHRKDQDQERSHSIVSAESTLTPFSGAELLRRAVRSAATTLSVVNILRCFCADQHRQTSLFTPNAMSRQSCAPITRPSRAAPSRTPPSCRTASSPHHTSTAPAADPRRTTRISPPPPPPASALSSPRSPPATHWARRHSPVPPPPPAAHALPFAAAPPRSSPSTTPTPSPPSAPSWSSRSQRPPPNVPPPAARCRPGPPWRRTLSAGNIGPFVAVRRPHGAARRPHARELARRTECGVLRCPHEREGVRGGGREGGRERE